MVLGLHMSVEVRVTAPKTRNKGSQLDLTDRVIGRIGAFTVLSGFNQENMHLETVRLLHQAARTLDSEFHAKGV